MVIVQTPFRISFFGGGTDYPVWFREHGGAVLATAIDKYIYTTCRLLPSYQGHKYRITYSKLEDVENIDEIVHPAVREVYRHMAVPQGLDLHHDSDIPARTGMGSSSSFVVGLMHALYALRGELVDKQRLAEEAIHVEQDLIGENVGCQDQIMAAFGGFNQVNFHTGGGFTVRPVTIRAPRLIELQSHLMLFYTGIQRLASEVAGEQIKNTPARATELKAMQQMVPEGMSLLCGEGSILDFGRLLHESWQLKKQLSGKITNAEIDDVYAAGMTAGAVGGKLLGAGGGGFILFMVPPEKQKEVRMRLGKLVHVPFGFDQGGTNLVFYRKHVAI